MNDAQTARSLPCNLDAERAFLGAALINPDAFALGRAVVGDGDFWRDGHRRTFRAMAALADAGHRIDLVSVKDLLARRGDLDEVGVAYLAAMPDGVPRSLNIEQYGRTVKAYAQRREIVVAARQFEDEAYNADDPGELSRRAAEVFSEFATAGGAVHRYLPSITLGELLARPDEPIDWRVDQRLRGGTLNMLAGKPKAGKSTLARDLALQVAQGGCWLSWPCASGAVWYLCFEDHEDDVKRHFAQMGARPTDPIRLFFLPVRATMIADLRREAVRDRPALIIVDTMQRLIDVYDLNDYADVTRKLTPLIELARESGACVLLVHHASKGERRGIDAVLGSTALTGSCSSILFLSRNEHQHTLHTIQRVGRELPETLVELDPTCGRSRLGASRRDADVLRLMDEMWMVLEEAREPVPQAELLEQVEGKATLKLKALRQLTADGRVVQSGEGKAGDPFRYAVTRSLPVPGLGPGKEERTSTAPDSTPGGSTL